MIHLSSQTTSQNLNGVSHVPIVLQRPLERIQTTVRLDPDVHNALNRLAQTKRMKKTDVTNQVMRAGLLAIGEAKPPAVV